MVQNLAEKVHGKSVNQVITELIQPEGSLQYSRYWNMSGYRPTTQRIHIFPRSVSAASNVVE
jgi:hypothetical protein